MHPQLSDGIDLIFSSMQSLENGDGFYIFKDKELIYISTYKNFEKMNTVEVKKINEIITVILKKVMGFEGVAAFKAAILLNGKIRNALDRIDIFDIMQKNSVCKIMIGKIGIVIDNRTYTYDNLKLSLSEKIEKNEEIVNGFI